MGKPAVEQRRGAKAGRPQHPARLYQRVANALADGIRVGLWSPGERLPAERELAQQHAVSRPTVREAVIALELEGLVEVKLGSGVYVADPAGSRGRLGLPPVPMDVGPFELTEARILMEGEVAALAASIIGPEEIAGLEALVVAMEEANRRGEGETIDRQFHRAIAEATRNSALVAVVDQLWTIRARSPQCVAMFDRARARGVQPVVAEHAAIVAQLAAGSSEGARAAMQAHLSRVLGYLLDASETEAIEEAKAQFAAQRHRYAAGLTGGR